jgi:hypothetical protein
MPDRRLRPDEMKEFLTERERGKPYSAFASFMQEKTEPSLHDLCLSELFAIVHAQKNIIVDMGAKQKILEKKIEDFEKHGKTDNR